MAIKKNRSILTEERNNRIEEMGIEELKHYLCMKHNQKPEACGTCPGIGTCKAGQRAVVLLNEANKTDDVSTPKKKTLAETREENRRVFEIACQQPKMIEWLMAHDGCNRDAARVKLKYWAGVHTDIAEKYGFWEKHESQRVLPKNEKVMGEARTEKAMRRYREAMAQDDPVQFLMDKYGIAKKSAWNRIGYWKNKYGKLEKPEDKKAVTETVANSPAFMEADEVSLDDFLNSTEPVAAENVHDVKVDAEPVQKPTHNACGVPMELVEKQDQIAHEMDRVNQQIHDLQEQYKLLKKAHDSLDMAISLIGTKDVSAKGLTKVFRYYKEGE